MSTAAASAQRPVATSGDGELTHRQILTVLGGLMLGMFLAALDQTVVSTAIRTIADDLSGLNLQAWATTAFLITSTITTPLYGKLSDIFGRKPLFMTAITIFLIGSVACTLAWSMYSLAAFRALQGLGAGGLMSLALTILGDIVPPRERARYQGFFLAVFGTSSVIGPVIGGLLSGVDTIVGIDGWRWIFLVNVPIGLAALVAVLRAGAAYVPLDPDTPPARLARLVLHPTCSATQLGLLDPLRRLAGAVADDVVVPDSWSCCGFAGDRGMLHPELTAAATAPQAWELAGVDADAFDATADRSWPITAAAAGPRPTTSPSSCATSRWRARNAAASLPPPAASTTAHG